jgi:hypothetical protein
MPPPRTFLIAALGLTLPGVVCCRAQDTWEAYLQHWRGAASQHAAWALLVREGDYPAGWWRRDPNLALLMAEGELAVESLKPEAAATPWRLRDWGDGVHWLLLDANGGHCFDGQGQTSGEAVLAAIHGVQERTLWEQREAFLKEHPDHGEALEARLNTGLQLALFRFWTLGAERRASRVRLDQPGHFLLPPEESAAVADTVFAEAAESLERLNRLPDGWRLSGSGIYNLGFYARLLDGQASPRMRAALLGAAEGALAEWSRSPNLEGLTDMQSLYGPAGLWLGSQLCLGEGAITGLPRLRPSPGLVFPQVGVLIYALNQIRDPAALLEFVTSIPEDAPEGPLTQEQWKAYRHRQSVLSAIFAHAYAHLGRWEEALTAIKDCRRWCGSDWGEMFLLPELKEDPAPATAEDPVGESPKEPARRKAPTREPRSDPDAAKTPAAAPKPDEVPVKAKPEPRPPEAPGQARKPPQPPGFSPGQNPGPPPQALLDLLHSKPEPDLPPPPAPAPIRLSLFGAPAWAKDWSQLARAADFAPWGADELRWQAPSPEDAALRTRLGWSEPRWMAIQGADTILASGTDLPERRLLALQLSAAGTSRLQRLATFIRRNPEQLDARRERFRLLRPHLGDPELTPLLAEDAARAWIPLDFPQDACGPLQPWQTQAGKLLPELEAALGRWPSSRSLWRLWVSWQPFRPVPLSPYGFALSLPVPRAPGPWLADLPTELHRAVAAELRAGGRYGQMRDWFQAAWDAAQLARLDPAGNREMLYQGLAEALTALHQKTALQELNRQYHASRLAKP